MTKYFFNLEYTSYTCGTRYIKIRLRILFILFMTRFFPLFFFLFLGRFKHFLYKTLIECIEKNHRTNTRVEFQVFEITSYMTPESLEPSATEKFTENDGSLIAFLRIMEKTIRQTYVIGIIILVDIFYGCVVYKSTTELK